MYVLLFWVHLTDFHRLDREIILSKWLRNVLFQNVNVPPIILKKEKAD